ncbi:hypothetical protein BLL42_13015 [Pseudomonas frederiksbergensis]|uniref:Transcriptional regulator n=1 Tax=Pseudomonas frederiksbergensis TaxID=104087 RepID=A0A1J0ELA8_9PSED|nr:hypothetical protein [Pseudomonas frederiksbergensis]APC16604.1 hypothetical protein BLL42_13015 [Pseudomonas frederiksbergensis]
MDIKPIQSDEDLANALSRIEQLWGAALTSPEGNELEALATLVKIYEDEHMSIPAPCAGML